MVGEPGLRNNFVYCKNKIVTPLPSTAAPLPLPRAGHEPGIPRWARGPGWSQDMALGDMVYWGHGGAGGAMDSVVV